MEDNIDLYLNEGRSLMITLLEIRNNTLEVLRHLGHDNEFIHVNGEKFYGMLMDGKLEDGSYALSRLNEVVSKAKTNIVSEHDKSLYTYMMIFCINHRSYFDYAENVYHALNKYQRDRIYFEDTKIVIKNSFDRIINNQQSDLFKKCEAMMDKLFD